MVRHCASRKGEDQRVEVNQEEYIRQVLDAYRKTPGTTGTARRPDRLLAAQLHQRGVPMAAIENAMILAAARRLIRPAGSPTLGNIRSLAYFLPVIDEVLRLRVSPDYFRYLRQKIAHATTSAMQLNPCPGNPLSNHDGIDQECNGSEQDNS